MALLYSAALLLNAALLFVLEPLVGKLVLPLLGATPQVWTTTVLFFQAALLAGYAYGHLTSRLAPRRQALLQVGLVAVAAIALPIGVSGARPPHGSNPAPWLLGLLVTTAGAPFVVLAANAPLLQRWLSRVRHPAARDPYFLFAASNSGSLLGLLAYPLVLEPLLTLHDQERLWSFGYAAAGVLVAASAALLWLRPAAAAAPAARVEPSPPWRRRLRWLALALVPSSLMLGTTTYLTRDLAPIPLLWVVPLAVYLATFIAAFAPGVRAERLARAARWVLPGVAIGVVYTLAIGSQRPLWLLLALHLAGLAAAGLMCHSLLAADRPPPSRLTEYYLWVAAGGVAGGIFNALIAPLVFPGLVEYPLAIVAALALRPPAASPRPALLEFLLRDRRPTQLMDAVVPALLLAALAVALEAVRSGGGGIDARSALVGVACGLGVNLARRPVRFALGMGAILLAATLVPSDAGHVLDRDRSFYGIYRVVASSAGGRYHELYDGTTLHGAERLAAGRPDPLTYYSHAGPAGQAFAELPVADTRRAALIGLGAGALACDAPPRADWTFLEIDPVVARIARDPRLFTYLRDCPGRFRIVLGDGRLQLARQPPRGFGVVVVDAFASDAIPVHLITRQAIELYFSRLTAGGALLFHISNRYLDLEPVLGNLARDRGLVCLTERHTPTPAQAARGYSLSQWALLARSRAALGRLGTDARWRACRDDPSARVWTDDYSSVLSVVKWG